MTLPRILVVHNRYQAAGGEDAVVDDEIALLRERGHAVEAYLRDNRELEHMGALDAFGQALWARRSARELDALLAAFRPDVVHVHNTFARVSASVYWAAARASVPVVQTLHNFRLMCVQAMFLRDGRVCEDCVGRAPWRGVLHKCYRGSRAQSAGLAAVVGLHRALGTYRHRVARYIALTEFCRRKFIEGGLPAHKIMVKPNFVPDARPPCEPRRGGLYVGRLSPEKGIDVLLAALDEVPGAELDVVGAGPEASKVAAHPRARLLGWRAAHEVRARMARAAYLVMPSLWYENFPRTLVEAFAAGLPVIASRLGALEELVEDRFTGLLFEPGSAPGLARRIAAAERQPEAMRRMGRHARLVYETVYTPATNYQQLMAIYDSALAAARRREAA